MSDQRDWHRLFGLTWKDYLHDQPVRVEVEMDLSAKEQLLDVAVIRTGGPISLPLPDGLEFAAPHNLISFKSMHEALDAWALEEFLGYDVDYRKQMSPSMQRLLAEEDFRLFAVCARFPRVLSQTAELQGQGPGVYDIRRFAGTMRIVVVSELPQEPRNAPLHLFAATAEQRGYGARTYEPRSEGGSRLLLQLFEGYRKERLPMPYTWEDLERDAMHTALRRASVEMKLEGISPEQRVAGLPAEERVKGLSVDELLAAMPPEKVEELRKRLAAKDAP